MYEKQSKNCREVHFFVIKLYQPHAEFVKWVTLYSMKIQLI